MKPLSSEVPGRVLGSALVWEEEIVCRTQTLFSNDQTFKLMLISAPFPTALVSHKWGSRKMEKQTQGRHRAEPSQGR